MPSADWRQRALSEGFPDTALPALLALARVGASEDQLSLLDRLRSFPFDDLREDHKFALLRTIQVSLARHGPPSGEVRTRLVGELDARYPSPNAEMNQELTRILLHLEAPNILQKTADLLRRSTATEDQLFYIEQLRNVGRGWLPSDRETFFAWFLPPNRKASGEAMKQYFADVKRSYVDGASYDSYLRDFRRQALATLSPAERKQLEPLLAQPIVQAQLVPANPRQFVRAWKMEDLLPDVRQSAPT